MGQGVSSVFDCVSNPLHDEKEEGYYDESGGGTTLEAFVPLRSSRLWGLHTRYYEEMGIRAWSEGCVPNFVTSNSFIARSYARMVVGALWDIHRGSPGGLNGTPVHLLEVGAGHGKLGYLIVDALLSSLSFLPPLGGGSPPGSLPFRYIVSDPFPGNLAAMQANPRMAKLVATGAVDFALFNAQGGEEGLALKLVVAGTTLAPPLAHPLIAIANYVVDGLRTDAFHVAPGGGLSQVTVSLSARVEAEEEEEEEEGKGEGEGVEGGNGGSRAATGAGAGEVAVAVAPPSGSSTKGVGAVVSPPLSLDQVRVQWTRVPLQAFPPGDQEVGEGVGAVAAPLQGKKGGAGQESEALLQSSTSSSTSTSSASASDSVKLTPSSSSSSSTGPSIPLGEPYTSSPFLSSLLTSYSRSASALRDKGGIVLLPLGGFEMLGRLRALSGGKCMVLMGDKGHSSLGEMTVATVSKDHPHLAIHGSISLMVNFHALRHWVRCAGGFSLSTPHAEGFKVVAAFLGCPTSASGSGSSGSGSGSSGNSAVGASLVPPPLSDILTTNSTAAVAAAAAASAAAALVPAREAFDLEGAAEAVSRYCKTGVPPLPMGEIFSRGGEVPSTSSTTTTTISNTSIACRAGCTLPWYPLASFGGAFNLTASAPNKQPAGGGSIPEALPPPITPTYATQVGGFPVDDDGVNPSGGGDQHQHQHQHQHQNQQGSEMKGWFHARVAAIESLGGSWLAPDDFAVLQRGVREEIPEPSLSTSLTLLRLSGHDSDVFLKFRSVLQTATFVGLDVVRGGGGEGGGGAGNPGGLPPPLDPILGDLRDDIDRVYTGYYPLQPSKDVCFELARLLMNIHEYPAALRNFKRSRAYCGEHHVTLYNEGLCHNYLGDLPAALACFNQCLALSPHYSEALGMKAKVETELLTKAQLKTPYPTGTGAAVAVAVGVHEEVVERTV